MNQLGSALAEIDKQILEYLEDVELVDSDDELMGYSIHLVRSLQTIILFLHRNSKQTLSSRIPP
jgi:hypothetical protein